MPRIQHSTTLLGASGNDTLNIAAGITNVNGGAGTDTAVFANPLDWYTITQSSTGIKVKNTHTGTTVTLTGIEIIDFAGGTAINAAGATLTQSSGRLNLTAAGGNNSVALGPEVSTVVLNGSNNTLALGTGKDTVTLGTGSDVLTATAATLNTADHLNGGTGSNTFALSGGGTVNLAAIAQFVNFQTIALDATGTNLTLNNAALTVTAAGGNNVITLGSGADSVTLGAGNDTVTLGTGVDTVSLGGGNDTLKATAASLNAADHLDGGAGVNALSLTGGGTANLAALAQFTNFQTVALDATGTTLTLGSAPETVTAAGGNNVLTLGSGVDSVSLGNGNDVVSATAASLNAGDHLIGGTGSNVLSITGGGPVNLAALAQLSNFQTVRLDASGTTLTLGSTAETVTAAGGNNTVTLGSGLETIALGSGDDTVYADGATLNAGDHIDGGGGSNTLVLSGGGVVLAQFSNFQTVMLGSSGTTLTISSDPLIVATGGNNIITLGNFANTVTLGDGNDVLTLGGGFDTVHMGGGNDIINLTASTINAADTLDGGTGANTIVVTGGGTVSLPGLAQVTNFQKVMLDGSGTTLTLTNDPTTLTASGGDNVVMLGNGLDTVTLGAGNDTVMVGDGAANGSVINGGAGQNVAVFADTVTTYAIAPTTAGVDVTNEHTGAVVHVANIGTIDFAGGAVYDVASGKLAGGPAPTTPPSTYPTTVTITPGSEIGTVGNDTLSVDLSTKSGVFVDGGPGNDTAVMTFGYSNWYQIVKNADGSVDMTEVHGTGHTAHLVNIETVLFGDAQYDVASGQFSAPSQAPSSGGSGSSTTTTTPPPPAPPPTTTYPTTVTVTPGSEIGTTGNDTINVDLSTQSGVFVDGGPGNDTAVMNFGYSNWYQVVKNADGSVDLTEVHATGHTAHLVNVETIQFGDAQYDVASGQFSAVTQAPSSGGGTTTPSSAPSTSTAILTAPVLPQAHNPGEIVAFELQNNQSTVQSAHEISFGQAFAAGQVPAGSHLVAVVNGVEIPVQMDVETTNPDGSARMAIITVDAPAIAANSSTDFMLKLSSAPVTTPNVDISALTKGGYSVDLNLTVHHADGTIGSYSLDAATLLANALKSGAATTWMSGPQATEVRVNAPIEGSLHAVFDIRSYADGTTHTDVELVNDLAFTANGGNITYDATLTQNGATVLQQGGITQAQYTSWHQELWSNGAPNLNVVHDISYLERTGAIQAFDTSAGVSQSVIDTGAAAALAKSGILGTADVTQYMGMTGGRPDIGPTTGANAAWLLTQSQTAEQWALAQADASGSIPWHITDATTGNYVSLVNHPNLWVDYRGGVASGTTGLPQPVGGPDTTGGWSVDPAHQPDLSYDAYLLTGSHYYLDQLQAQASYDIASEWPVQRNNGAGLVTNSGDQVRAEAWNLRQIGEAAFLSPDSSPLKPYFQQILTNNVANLLTEAQTSTQGAVSGWQQGIYGSGNGAIAPWQQDYFASTMVGLAEQSVAGATQFLQWENNFISGRFLNASNGFDPHNGITYNLFAYDPATNAPYTTWAQVQAATVAGGLDNNGTWLNTSNEYMAGARASLAGMITTTGSPDAIAAFGWLIANAPGANPAIAAADDISFATIAPRLADGNLLTAANIHVYDSTAPAVIQADNNDQLIYATTGNHTVVGGSGIDLLYAGSGNDTLIGGSNNDFLFGGSGQSHLDGGAGNNYLRSGTGPTTFVFDAAGPAQDTISQFKPGVDILEVHEIAGRNVTAAQLIATATQDAAGDAILHLDPTHSLVLLGVHTSQLQTGWFHLL